MVLECRVFEEGDLILGDECIPYALLRTAMFLGFICRSSLDVTGFMGSVLGLGG